MIAWWTGLSAAEAPVECGRQVHTLRWERGELTAVDHRDPEGEATLAALAGETVPCLDRLRAWRRRRTDIRVLTLGSRGIGDPLQIDLDAHRHPRAPVLGRRETELLELLALGGSVPDRLQAHVAATWARRLATGHSTLDATLPQLHAALHGRLLATLRPWLGEPGLSIELTMADPGAERRLLRVGDTIAVALPFAWLTEVWARGLTTCFGRLCLAADTTHGTHWTLDTVAADLGETATIVVTLT